MSLFLCCLLLALSVVECKGSVTTASVYFNGSVLQVTPDVVDKEKAVAYAVYNDTITENGWRELHIAAGYSTSGQFTNEDVMIAAGMLEGFLSHEAIYSMYQDMYGSTFVGKQLIHLQEVKDFYSKQREWAEKMVESEAATSDTWYYTGLLLAQFKGLQQGYAKAAPASQQLEVFAFDFLSGNGDYLDIKNVVSPEDRPDVNRMSKEELLSEMHKGHCSALIKLLPGYENIYASHSSWYKYSAMNRIYKHYAFKVSAEGRKMRPAMEVMSFSSYPAYLSSLDDFYIMDSGLVMLQTTIGVFKKEVYDQSTSKALLSWHRVRLANWLAASGKEWAGFITQYNSGTYNNQYMVLDLKQVELKKAMPYGWWSRCQGM